jgi:predicted acylesterase/phospholipase RssA
MTAPTEEVAPAAAAGAPRSEELLGLALSGGGIRAALFSLGVLVCLVDCGGNRRVRSMTSVSGGSIVNAFVAQNCDFSACGTPEEFEPVAKEIAESLAMKGAWGFSVANLLAALSVLLRGIPSFVIGILVNVIVDVRSNGTGDIEWPVIRWAIVIPVTVAVLVLTTFVTRGPLQRIRYSAILKRKGALREPKLTDFVAGNVNHVLVSTDLLSGQPVFFSREFVYCAPYGWGVPGDFATADALYASAAFPVVFPPLGVSAAKFRFQNGVATPPFPKRLKLVDGGVFNNLGTDWYEELERQRDAIWKFGELEVSYPSVSRMIIVNAGAPNRPIARLQPLQWIAREMSVLYDNTVRPRIAAIHREAERSSFAALLIDIDESPMDFARRLANSADGPISGRAQEMARRLEAQSPKYWIQFARQTAGTKTKLSKAGRDVATRLMLHGYLSALVLMHSVYAVDIDKIRGEEYFLQLTGRKTPKASESRAAKKASAAEASQTTIVMAAPEPADQVDTDERVRQPK